MPLSHCVIATDLNTLYTSFVPLVHRAWRSIVGVDVCIVVVGDHVPSEWSQEVRDDCLLFRPATGVPTGFQAQTVRLLAPGWIVPSGGSVVISDADMIPLSQKYFQRSCAEKEFFVYRDGVTAADQIACCYVAARPRTWFKAFGSVATPEEARARITQWWRESVGDQLYSSNQYGPGAPKQAWYTDQRLLKRYLHAWGNSGTGTIVRLTDSDTAFRRLDRATVDVTAVPADLTPYVDFHALRPHEGTNKTFNEAVVAQRLQGNKGALHCIFDRIYCINLDRSTDRWKQHREHFVEFGLTSQRFAAIDGSKHIDILKDARTAGIVDRSAVVHFTQSVGAIGLAWTSYKLWKHVATDDDAEWVLIVEDDVRLHPMLKDEKFVQELWSHVPKDAEVVQLGYHMKATVDDAAFHMQSVNDRVWRVVQCVTGTHAYALRRSAASKMVTEHVPFCKPVDYFKVDRMRVYAFKALSHASGLLLRNGTTWFSGIVSVMGDTSTITTTPALDTEPANNRIVSPQPDGTVDLTKRIRGALASVFGSRIYCINLDRSPDRWKAQQTQFEQHLQVDVERVPAIDGRSEPSIVDDALRQGIIAPNADFLGMERNRKNAVTALIVTTVRLWRRIASLPGLSDPWCLICEDDAQLEQCARDRAYVNYVCSQVPKDAAVVLLGFTLHYGHHIRDDNDVANYVEQVNTAVCRVRKLVCGAHCYAIKRSTATKLLEMCLPFSRALDMSFPIDRVPVYAVRNPPSTWASQMVRSDHLRVHYGIAGVLPFDSTINAQQYSKYQHQQHQQPFENILDKLRSTKKAGEAAVEAHRAAVYAHKNGGGNATALAYALASRALGNRSWRNDDEIAVCGYWSGAYSEARNASLRELDDPALPQSERKRVATNLAFAQRKLGLIPRKPPTRYVTVALRSGLGNQMFIVAAAHAYALRTGRQLLLHALPIEVSNATRRPTYWTSVLHRFHAYGEQWWPHANPRVHHEQGTAYAEIPAYETDAHVHLVGFFQSCRYCDDRALFTPSVEVEQLVESLYAKYRVDGKQMVAVHVRRGDFVHYPKQFPMLPLEYYRRAILDHFDTTKSVFLVFSDAVNDARSLLQPLTSHARIVFVEEQLPASVPDYVHMYLMARCDGGHVIANSTFSWWAARLRTQSTLVVMPKPWFGVDEPSEHGLQCDGWKEVCW